VRKRWQMSSSDPPTSCWRSSRASNTRMGPGRRPASRGPSRETLGKTALHGGDESSPREGISPRAHGMGFRHKVGDVQRHSSAPQPMLEVANKAHRKRSSCKKGRGLQKMTRCSSPQGPAGGGE
jgi:hypothetical protein